MSGLLDSPWTRVSARCGSTTSQWSVWVSTRAWSFSPPVVWVWQVALHACGVATDMVVEHCIQARAAFVVSPCCYGFVQNTLKFSFPRRCVVLLFVPDSDTQWMMSLFVLFFFGPGPQQTNTQLIIGCRLVPRFLSLTVVMRVRDSLWFGLFCVYYYFSSTTTSQHNNLYRGLLPQRATALCALCRPRFDLFLCHFILLQPTLRLSSLSGPKILKLA